MVLLALSSSAPPGAAQQERGGGSPAAAPDGARPAYLERGDEVEARYQNHRTRLERFFAALGERLGAEAPDLRAKLDEAPPAPVPYGYRILPKIAADGPRTAGAGRILTTSFSWRRTGDLVDRDRGRLEKLETRLGEAAAMGTDDRRREYERMVDEYRSLAAGQKLIANRIQYNRLWQGEIARRPRVYDAFTVLHDAALERQALLDAFPLGDEEIEALLRAREEALERQIREETQKISPPAEFVRLDHSSPHRWIVRVPLFTDIEDLSFVDRFRASVENAWRVQDGDDAFSVAVEIRFVPASRLYPDGEVPERGAHIDLGQHIGRFPPDGAVLTTGAGTLHVLGRGINLGPHDTTPNVLAHEFGHLLGFPDGYFRGYRDRGAEGYDVLEVVLDLGDIMSAPGVGRVGRQHFQQLLEVLQGRRP